MKLKQLRCAHCGYPVVIETGGKEIYWMHLSRATHIKSNGKSERVNVKMYYCPTGSWRKVMPDFGTLVVRKV